ncbi:MAG: 2Fe-2S iron-sulfur cluster-binding protein [Chitinophagaceae bacterium]
MEHYNMNLELKVWRQRNASTKGNFETFKVADISSEMSFLEMFDVLNEKLIHEGKDPIAFDHDCREGICGSCSMYVNGKAHGPWEKILFASYTCVHLKMVIPL